MNFDIKTLILYLFNLEKRKCTDFNEEREEEDLSDFSDCGRSSVSLNF